VSADTTHETYGLERNPNIVMCNLFARAQIESACQAFATYTAEAKQA